MLWKSLSYFTFDLLLTDILSLYTAEVGTQEIIYFDFKVTKTWLGYPGEINCYKYIMFFNE